MNTTRNLAILLLMAVLRGDALAQFETATVLGTVRDASNAVVPEATVTLDEYRDGVSAPGRRMPKAATSSSP